MSAGNGKKCIKHKWIIMRVVAKGRKTYTFYECVKCSVTKFKVK